MATKKLSRLKLDPAVARGVEAVSRRGIRLATVGDVLHFSDFELVEMLDVPHGARAVGVGAGFYLRRGKTASRADIGWGA